jgi:hypothetical protein
MSVSSLLVLDIRGNGLDREQCDLIFKDFLRVGREGEEVRKVLCDEDEDEIISADSIRKAPPPMTKKKEEDEEDEDDEDDEGWSERPTKELVARLRGELAKARVLHEEEQVEHESTSKLWWESKHLATKLEAALDGGAEGQARHFRDKHAEEVAESARKLGVLRAAHAKEVEEETQLDPQKSAWVKRQTDAAAKEWEAKLQRERVKHAVEQAGWEAENDKLREVVAEMKKGDAVGGVAGGVRVEELQRELGQVRVESRRAVEESRRAVGEHERVATQWQERCRKEAKHHAEKEGALREQLVHSIRAEADVEADAALAVLRSAHEELRIKYEELRLEQERRAGRRALREMELGEEVAKQRARETAVGELNSRVLKAEAEAQEWKGKHDLQGIKFEWRERLVEEKVQHAEAKVEDEKQRAAQSEEAWQARMDGALQAREEELQEWKERWEYAREELSTKLRQEEARREEMVVVWEEKLREAGREIMFEKERSSLALSELSEKYAKEAKEATALLTTVLASAREWEGKYDEAVHKGIPTVEAEWAEQVAEKQKEVQGWRNKHAALARVQERSAAELEAAEEAIRDMRLSRRAERVATRTRARDEAAARIQYAWRASWSWTPASPWSSRRHSIPYAAYTANSPNGHIGHSPNSTGSPSGSFGGGSGHRGGNQSRSSADAGNRSAEGSPSWSSPQARQARTAARERERSQQKSVESRVVAMMRGSPYGGGLQARLRETEVRLERAEEALAVARRRVEAAEAAVREHKAERGRLKETAEQALGRAEEAEAEAARHESVLRSTITQMMQQTALRQKAESEMAQLEEQLETMAWEEKRRHRLERRKAEVDGLSQEAKQEEEKTEELQRELLQTRATAKRAAQEENEVLRMELRRARSVAKRAEAAAARTAAARTALTKASLQTQTEGAGGAQDPHSTGSLPSWISEPPNRGSF